ILDRGYTFKKGTALVPSFLAFAVVQLLEKHFGHLVDYDFTAQMEDCLDEIARGETERVPWLRRFYFGENGDEGLKELVTDLGEIDAKGISSFPVKDSDIMVRVGRYGPYLDRDGERVNIPEDLAPDELDAAKAEELFAQPSGDRELGKDPESGRVIVAKSGRFGPYVTEILPEEPPPAEGEKKRRTKKDTAKPRTGSLLRSMSLDTVTLDDALMLLSLPRVLGDLDGEQVTAQNGRYGPYVKKGTDSRSLQSEEELFTVTLEQAKELFAQPKQRGRGRAAAAPPLRELGDDPASGKPVVVKEGRFGPYVTDGETNASLRKGDDVESITIQRAAELLAERREKVAAGGGGRKTRTTTTRRTTKSRS
ncbi:MAG: topoisomerase C-terminal repeat-containing protein, partial [Actinomadura sp.]